MRLDAYTHVSIRQTIVPGILCRLKQEMSYYLQPYKAYVSRYANPYTKLFFCSLGGGGILLIRILFYRLWVTQRSCTNSHMHV